MLSDRTGDPPSPKLSPYPKLTPYRTPCVAPVTSQTPLRAILTAGLTRQTDRTGTQDGQPAGPLTRSTKRANEMQARTIPLWRGMGFACSARQTEKWH